MIARTNGKYYVLSHTTGRNMGSYSIATYGEQGAYNMAKKRLRTVKMFSNR